ncbi:zinc finger, CCHC-type containing protein [Tanacetum coccineum]
MSGKDNTSKVNEIGPTTHFQCPILKGENYTTWAIRMQIILEANGLWEMIEPNKKTQADNRKDKTAIAFLYQAHIGEEIAQARLQTLKSDFEMLHMKEDEAIDTFTAKLTTLIVASIEQYSDLEEMSVEEAIRRLKTFEERIKVKKGKAFEDQDKLLFAKHNDNGRRHHYDDQGGGRYIPLHSRNSNDNRQHGKEESFSQDYNEEMRKPRDFSKVKYLEPTLLMASTSFNKTQRKSSKDTPTNKSIWFAKDYDHEDSKFGEIILEEDEGGHDQDYDKLNLKRSSSFLANKNLVSNATLKLKCCPQIQPMHPQAPVDLYRDKRVPDRREDGWMEVRVWEFVYNNEIKDNYIPMELKLACLGGTMSGLIICGVEFRPL